MSGNPDPDLARAVMAALDGDRTELEIARMLIGEGCEVNGTHDGDALLDLAIMADNTEIAEMLLEAGARFDIADFSYGSRLFPSTQGRYEVSPASDCQSEAMAAVLGRYDPPFDHFEEDLLPHATGAALIPAQEITPKIFNHRSLPRYGRANPELCDNPFYLEQIRTGRSGYAAGHAVLGKAHKSFRGAPVWSFHRFGRSYTRLPDGRLVLIAGEHEDFYDADFNIYNDVTVLDGKGGVQHFLYPQEDFPPTDFHTATLIGDHIWIIGSLGYQGYRPEGVTQVLRLDLLDFSVRKVDTTGDNPGWICRHKATLEGDEIVIAGGKVEPGYSDLDGVYALNLSHLTWRRIS